MNIAALRSWVAPWFIAAPLACQPLRDLDAASRGAATASPSTTLAPTSGPDAPFTPDATDTVSSATEPVLETTPDASATSASAPAMAGGATTHERTESATPSEQSSQAATTSIETSEVSNASNPTTTEPPQQTATSSAHPSSDTSAGENTNPSSAPSCQTQCGFGEPCTSASQCLSLRCDEQCLPTELTVESDGLDAVSTSIKVHIELYADPAVPLAWKDLAVLYFFTVERRDDFVMHFQQGGGSAMPVQVDLNEWMLVWRTDREGNVPSTVTPFDVQFRSQPWLPDTPESNNNANDHSYREDLGPNENIVLCRFADGQWKQIQGTPPAAIPDPCQYVDHCDAALHCDPLQEPED